MTTLGWVVISVFGCLFLLMIVCFVWSLIENTIKGGLKNGKKRNDTNCRS